MERAHKGWKERTGSVRTPPRLSSLFLPHPNLRKVCMVFSQQKSIPTLFFGDVPLLRPEQSGPVLCLRHGDAPIRAAVVGPRGVVLRRPTCAVP